MRRSPLLVSLALLSLGLVLHRAHVPALPDATAQAPRHRIALPVLEAGRSASEPDVVVVGAPWEPESLYLHGGTSSAQDLILGAIYDGPIDPVGYAHQPVILERLPRLEDPDGDAVLELVTVAPGEAYVDEATGEVVTATETIADLPRLTARFRILEGVTWQDGVPLTAADSVFSRDLACHPDTPTDKHLCARTSHYRVIDERTIEWRGLPGFADPRYDTRIYPPLPRHQLGAHGRRMDATPAAEVPEDPVFTRAPLAYGPFRIVSWEDGEAIHLARNPHYWRAREGLPRLDRLSIRFESEPPALLHALRDGAIDVVAGGALERYHIDALEEARAAGELEPVYGASAVWEHLDFNLLPADDRPAFGACRGLRRAIAHGTDRALMTEVLLGGRVPVLDGYAPAEHWAHPPPGSYRRYPYDPVAAARMLDDVGFVDEDGDPATPRVAIRDISCPVTTDQDGDHREQVIPAGTPLRLWLNTTQGNVLREEITLLFQMNMADIGVDVDLEYLPANILFHDGIDGPLFGRRFDLAVFAWFGGVTPPVAHWRCDQIPSDDNLWTGDNLTGWCSPAFDHQTGLAARALARDGERSAHREAMRIFMDELPVLPLFPRLEVRAIAPGLRGFRPDPIGGDTWNVEAWAWGEGMAPRRSVALPARVAQEPARLFLPVVDRDHARHGRGAPPPAAPGRERWTSVTSSRRTRAVAVDHAAGVAWVGTSQGGLVRWDLGSATARVYTPADGLPDSTVSAVVLDGVGAVWAATAGGLTRIGPEGTWTTTTFGDRLRDFVHDLALAPDSSLWLATSDGVVHVRPVEGRAEVVATWTVADGLPERGIDAISVDAAGRAWVGTDSGVARLDADGVWRRVTTEQGLASDYVYDIDADAAGGVWFATDAGASHRDAQGRWRTYFAPEGRPPGDEDDVPSCCDVLAVHVAADGAVWASVAGRLERFAAGRWTRVPLTGHGIDASAIDTGPGSVAWLATSNGLVRVNLDGEHRRYVPDGLPDDRVNALAPDGRGGMWFGTLDGLSHRDASGTLRHWARGDGWLESGAADLAVAADGGLWLGGFDGVAHLSPSGATSRLTTADGLPSNEVFAVLVDGRGNRWFGTGEGLARLDPSGTWRHFTERDGLGSGRVTALAEDAAGGVWAGSSRRVTRFPPDDGPPTTPYGMLPSAGVRDLHVGPDGTLWIATDFGVARYTAQRGLRIHRYARDLGVHRIMALTVDPAGRLWLGTPVGLRLLEGTSVRAFRERDGLLDDLVQRLVIADDGALWIGMDSGASRLELAGW